MPIPPTAVKRPAKSLPIGSEVKLRKRLSIGALVSEAISAFSDIPNAVVPNVLDGTAGTTELNTGRLVSNLLTNPASSAGSTGDEVVDNADIASSKRKFLRPIVGRGARDLTVEAKTADISSTEPSKVSISAMLLLFVV